MTNKIFISLVAIALIIIALGFFRGKTATAPAQENNATAEIAENNQIKEEKNMELEIKTTKEGTGSRVVKEGDTISVHYTGKLVNGTKFDSSLDRGKPFEFTVGAGQVIKGWDLGFIGAKIGEKRTLTIPADLGYGTRDMGIIPPNSTLVFDVELISIK